VETFRGSATSRGLRTGEVVWVKASNRQRLEGHLLAPGVPLPRSVWSNKIKIADDLGVPVPELEYLQAIRHDASWVVRLRGSEMNRAFFGSALANGTPAAN
jgi:hypothetical protein